MLKSGYIFTHCYYLGFNFSGLSLNRLSIYARLIFNSVWVKILGGTHLFEIYWITPPQGGGGGLPSIPKFGIIYNGYVPVIEVLTFQFLVS